MLFLILILQQSINPSDFRYSLRLCAFRVKKKKIYKGDQTVGLKIGYK